MSGNDYNEVLREMVTAFGINQEARASVESVAEAIGRTPSAVARLRTFAERVGGLKVRYSAVVGEDGNSFLGRSAYWTFIHDPEWMAKEAKRLWDMPYISHGNLDKYMPAGENTKNGKHFDNSSIDRERRPSEPEQQQDEPSGIAQKLRPFRKNEIEALIEAARQYAGRESFIEEELKRFHEMGIEIDRSAIHFERNEVLETAAILAEHIARLNAATERQAAIIANLQSTSPATTDYIKGLKAEVERLRREAASRESATSELIDKFRTKNQRLELRVKQLEEELQRVATAKLQQLAGAH